jgi:sulfatase maturation enzyme AslB (radical SAM superfamily)
MDLTPYKECLAHKNSIYISNDDQPYKPCCWFDTGISANNVTEYRKQLAELGIASNCKHCIKQEQGGATWSHRKLFDNPKEFVLGVCFDNICNLKCVTCSPIHSSQLINEWDELKLYSGDKDKRFYTRISKQAPDKIEFIKDVLNNSEFDILRLEIFGGEPLINPNIFKFIDWVSDQPFAKSTMLSITSNSTVYSEKISEYASKFKYVGLQLSIDGIEDTFEYLRYGTDYAETCKNIQSYYDLLDVHGNFTLGMNYTLSWMNALHFVDFFNWAQTNYPRLHTHLTKLEGPDWYSVNILSLEQRQQILEYTTSKIDAPQTRFFEKLFDLYKQSLSSTNNSPFNQILFDKGIKMLKSIDELRDEDHNKVLNPIIEFIKK